MMFQNGVLPALSIKRFIIMLYNRNQTWWRHQTETFSALLALCAGNSPVSGEFPAQRPVTRSFDVFFDLRPGGRLSKHSWGWWLETPPCPLWRQSNEKKTTALDVYTGHTLKQQPSWLWHHQMETFSTVLSLCEGNPPVTDGFPHKGQWRRALMFSLICAWTNGWANNQDAGDLRYHRDHYDVSVTFIETCVITIFHTITCCFNEVLRVLVVSTKFRISSTTTDGYWDDVMIIHFPHYGHFTVTVRYVIFWLLAWKRCWTIEKTIELLYSQWSYRRFETE